MSGLLGNIYSQADRMKRHLGGLLSDPIGSIQQTAGLLGDFRNEDSTLNQQAFGNPQNPLQVTDQSALGLLADRTLAGPMSFAPLGMIKTAAGRIPETTQEIDKFADYLLGRARALKLPVESGASNVSGSRYVAFKTPETDFQVRLSNHGDRYPGSFTTGDRFSVDPDSGNTFEMAKDWLRSNGINLSQRAPKQATPPHPLAGSLASDVQALRNARGGGPLTAAEVKAMGLVDDLGLSR